MAKIKEDYPLPMTGPACMNLLWKVPGRMYRYPRIGYRQTLDGLRVPSAYELLPLIVHEALMIEPTETESMQTLDAFAAAMKAIAKEAREDPELLHTAPHNTPIRRCDEVKAARDLVLCCWMPDKTNR